MQAVSRFDNSIITLLFAIGCGLYGYGQNTWTGAGLGVIVGTVLSLLILVIISAIIDWAEHP